MLVLGNAALVTEFFEKRSANTSDRPRTHMIEL